MNWRDIVYGRLNSGLVRAALSQFFRPGKAYQIRFGPLRGLQLYYDRSVNFHAILGLWELETFQLLNQILVQSGILSAQSVAVDVGANIGYYTIWLAKRVVTRGQVYSFEPSSEVINLLSSNININKITNVQTIQVACGDRVGVSDFFIANHHHSSSLNAEWARGSDGSARKITVNMVTLDEFFEPNTKRRQPKFIKIDIEGGATCALPGCRRLLKEARPFLLIESHTPDEDRAISDVLCDFCYHAFRISNRRWVTHRERTYPDKDGVWGTLLVIPEEQLPLVAATIGSPGP